MQSASTAVTVHMRHNAYMHHKLGRNTRCCSSSSTAAIVATASACSMRSVCALRYFAKAVLDATAIDATLTADLFMCTATSRSMQRRIDDQQQTPRDFAQQQQAAFDQLDQRQQPASRSSSAFSSGSTEYTDGLKSAVRFDPTAANPYVGARDELLAQ
jgi:flagellar hook-basal body complex protein FliE